MQPHVSGSNVTHPFSLPASLVCPPAINCCNRLGALAGAVEIVFILSGSLENDSSHPCNYDAVKDAIRIQQAKLSTWPQDPVRLFPDTTLSPAISEMLTATLQQLPRNEPVVIPANNDYDSLRKYSLQVVAPEC
jgi:hypothetical protein